jgi:hypothetical protein
MTTMKTPQLKLSEEEIYKLAYMLAQESMMQEREYRAHQEAMLARRFAIALKDALSAKEDDDESPETSSR